MKPLLKKPPTEPKKDRRLKATSYYNVMMEANRKARIESVIPVNIVKEDEELGKPRKQVKFRDEPDIHEFSPIPSGRNLNKFCAKRMENEKENETAGIIIRPPVALKPLLKPSRKSKEAEQIIEEEIAVTDHTLLCTDEC
jgi:hypothetical protein